jgi:antibiotic biosynthesis monooxygenase (ABM) superfamily enzyme
MSKHIAAIDSAISHFETLRQQDISKAVGGFLSAHFTSGIAANLSMSYSPDPSTTPGRCYLSLLTLFAFYKSIEAFDEVAGPLQKRSIREFHVRIDTHLPGCLHPWHFAL